MALAVAGHKPPICRQPQSIFSDHSWEIQDLAKKIFFCFGTFYDGFSELCASNNLAMECI